MGGLLRYAAPTIAMMIFTSIYGIVDGLFVSNFAGKTALAAVNWSWPFLMMLSSVGFMMGTGGSALVAKTRGEGDDDRANRYFSMIVFFTLGLGILLAVVGAFCMRPVFALMGAQHEMLDMAMAYGLISLVSLPFFMLQNAFQELLVAAGKPKVGLAIIIAAGVTNMVLDALFIAGFGWGAAGAAAATAISEYVGGLTTLIYFARKNSSFLQLRWTPLEWRPIGKTCVNGSSEMVGNISMSLVSMLFNFQLMRLIGENGVAAYGVIMYVGMLFGAVLMGFCIGTSPLMSFQYGAGNKAEMQSLFRKCLGFMACGGFAIFIAAEACAVPVCSLFAGYDPELEAMTVHGFRIFVVCGTFMGVAMYGSALFTALNNGLISALISFLRTLLFEAGAVLVLPVWFGAEGIWFATPVADAAACAIAVTFIVALGRRYGYLRSAGNTEKAEGAL